MATLKVGVIGLGMGRGHILGYQGHPEAEVVAIADPDEQRLEEVSTEHHIAQRYTSAEKMLKAEKLDIVSVATPNKFHKPLTLAALKAGAHVLCEKPIALNAKEGQQMVDAARQAGRQLMINFSYRFTQQARALKQQVETGILGDVYFGRTVWHRRRGMPGFGGWFGQKAMSGGGPLIDLGVHRIDLALWLMGYPKPTWVVGGAYNHIASEIARKEAKQFDVEDLATGMVQFDNGAILEVEASWAANIKERELMSTRLLGTKAGLLQRNVNETYEFQAEIYDERDGRLWDATLHAVPDKGALGAMEHFVDCILNKKPNSAPGEQGVTVMKIIDAIYKSAQQGKPIKVS